MKLIGQAQISAKLCFNSKYCAVHERRITSINCATNSNEPTQLGAVALISIVDDRAILKTDGSATIKKEALRNAKF